jgi:dipeptidyl aminopeptidase/acylaminoacyl peptidase
MTETRIDSQLAAEPGAGRHPVAVDDILKLRPLSSPTVSPCGLRALVVVHRCDRKQNKYFQNLLLVDLEGDFSRPFTGGDQKDTSPAWSPDGSTVAFVSDRTGKQQIYLIRTDGGEATALTDLEKGSISWLRWSQDGTRLLFIYHRKPKPVLEKTVPETPPQESDAGADEKENQPPLVRVFDRIRYRFDGLGYLDEERDQIWTADLPDGKLTQLTSGPT